MSAARGPEELVRALSEERIPLEDMDAQAERRARLVPLIGQKVREARTQQDRRARLRRFAGLFAAAAVAALVTGVSYRELRVSKEQPAARAALPVVATVREVRGTLVMTHAGQSQVVGEGDYPTLAGGDELRTAADGTAWVQTERSAIHIEPATHVSMLPLNAAEERIRLALGRVDLKVSKQPQSPRSVVVETPNAEVVVHGTMFSVTVDSDHDTPVTHVRVTEGSVWVLHAGKRELLSIGDEWSSTTSAAPASAATKAMSEASQATPAAAPQMRAPSTSAAAHPAASSLGEENKMFQAAVDARNHGEDAHAVELFQALLARYPGGRLAEEARVERMRALRRMGNGSGAAAEARRYLAEHPHGYAQDEARGVALGGK